MPVLSAEQIAYLDGPNTILIATQDGRLEPACTHGLTLLCGPGEDRVTIWIPQAVAGRAEQNLRVDPRIAIVCNRASTHRALQLKGRAVRVRVAAEDRR